MPLSSTGLARFGEGGGRFIPQLPCTSFHVNRRKREMMPHRDSSKSHEMGERLPRIRYSLEAGETGGSPAVHYGLTAEGGDVVWA